MIKKILNSTKKFKLTSPEKQVNPVTSSVKEEEAICQNGVIGLEGLWDLYDMWI